MKTSLSVKPLLLPSSIDSAVPFTAVSSKNRCLMLGQSNGDLTRYLPNEKESQRIKFSSSSASSVSGGLMSLVSTGSASVNIKVDLASIFSSESGFHTLISSANGETYYLGLDSTTAYSVPKLKGHVVTAVWFTDDSSEVSVQCLIGTQAGKVMAAVIDAKKLELSTTRMVSEMSSTGDRITDIVVSRDGTLVSTQTCAYLLGGPGSSSLNLLWESPVPCLSSMFAIHNDIGGAHTGTCLSWLNGVCIVSTKLPIQGGSSNPSVSTVIPHAKNLKAPRGFMVTDYHYMVLYDSCKLVLISRISLGPPLAAITTPQSSFLLVEAAPDRIYLWSSGKITCVILSNEHVDSWKHWLKKRNYSKALASTQVQAERAYILKHEADFLLETATANSKAEAARKAASLYSAALKEDASFIESFFDEITWKLESADLESVLDFVLTRMDVGGEDSSKEVVQMSVLFIYSIHILIDLLCESPPSDLDRLRTILYQFVSDKHQSLDKECLYAAFEMFESVGLFAELVAVAEIVGDIDTAVRIDLKLGRYEEIIKRISLAPQTLAVTELTVTISPILFRFCPQQFVGMIIRKFSQIDEVIDVLAGCGALGREHKEQAILLLKSWSLKHHQKKLIDLLVSVSCECGDEEAVVQLIESTHTYLDSHFVLRCVRQYKLAKAETVLNSVKGLFLQATQRALASGDLELAKSCASRSPSAIVRRKCWIEIMRDQEKHSLNPKQLIELYKESENLQLTDLLPLLTSAGEDSLEGVKDEIDECIRDAQRVSEDTRREILNFQEALGQIRNDLTAKPNECILLSHSQKCDVCFKLVFSEPFLAFNCGHCFHEECLKETLAKRVSKDIGSSCCLCGQNSLLLEQLFEPFIDPAIDAAAIEAWTVSY